MPPQTRGKSSRAKQPANVTSAFAKQTPTEQQKPPTNSSSEATNSPKDSIRSTRSKVVNVKHCHDKVVKHDEQQDNIDQDSQGNAPEEEQQQQTSLIPIKLKTVSKLGVVRVKCLLGPNSNYAIYDPVQSRFTLSAMLDSKKSFALEKTTFLSGPYQGYQALVLVPVPVHRFPFLKLPAELRNMIYVALLAPSGYVVDLLGAVLKTSKARVSKIGTTYRARSSPHLTLATAILSVCKEIHEEASSVLYGCNLYRARHPAASQWFLKSIGSNIKYLRNYHFEASERFGSYGLPVGNPAMVSMSLTKATNLTRFNLDLRRLFYRSDRPKVRAMSVIQELSPLLRALLDREEDLASILNIITFDGNERCINHDLDLFSDDSPGHMNCVECVVKETGQIEFMKNFETHLAVTILKMQEEEVVKAQALAEAADRAKQYEEKLAQAKLNGKQKPFLRRETGRAKRKVVTDNAVSYVEVEEDENEFEQAKTKKEAVNHGDASDTDED